MYKQPKNSRKGENGKLLIIAGSKKFHGAAMLAILAARRFVDLVFFYPAEKDPYLINAVKTIPEVIVLQKLEKIEEMDCILFGNGIGNAKVDLKKLKGKLVVDADGLKQIKGKIPKGAILTPHEGEFKMLFGASGSEKNVRAMAKKYNCIILKKGPVDIISDGKKVYKNKTGNPGMTKGGTGDVLAGVVAALFCKNNGYEAAVEGAKLTGKAGDRLMKKFGYEYCAGDVADMLAKL